MTVRGVGERTVFALGSAPVAVTGVVVLEDLLIDGGDNGAIVATDAGLTVRGCTIADASGGDGAIFLQRVAPGATSLLRLQDSTIAGTSGARAVNVDGGSLVMEGCTLNNNAGGGVLASGDAGTDTAVIRNSTFAANSAVDGGGAVALFLSTTIESSTFVGNTAAVQGGAMVVGSALSLRNSVFIDNSAPVGATCVELVGDRFSVGDNTSDDDSDCPMEAGSDIVNPALTSSVFGLLTDNGGHTETFLPIEGATLVETIIGAGTRCGGVDQRGASRDIASCDRGAVEVAGAFLATAMAASVESPGVHCAQGGHRIAAGLDDGDGILADAGDGVLSGPEEDSVIFLCTDATLETAVSVENDDGTCPAGGLIIHSGVDDNGDGALAPGERDRTDHLCNGTEGADGADGTDGVDGATGPGGTPGRDGTDGADGAAGQDGQNGGAGFSSLLRTSTVDPGDEGCVAGGQRIEGGLDDGAGGESAGDGVLGDGEVDATAVLCNGRNFEDEFETSGGPTCSSGASAGSLWALAALLLAAVPGRRRRA